MKFILATIIAAFLFLNPSVQLQAQVKVQRDNSSTDTMANALKVPGFAKPNPNWLTLGNKNTTYGKNFLGTTDLENLMFKVNSVVAGRIEMTPLGNTGIGYQSLLVNNGVQNTAMGAGSLQSNTSGMNNTSVGFNALNANIEGFSNIAVGTNSLLSNTSGHENIAVGVGSLANSVNGAYNIAIGSATMNRTTNSLYDVAIGYNSMLLNTTGSDNTAIGSFAMISNTTGGDNTAVGYHALYNNGSTSLGGGSNTAVGVSALSNNITGNNNIGIGSNANVKTGDMQFATAIGSYSVALDNNSVVIGSPIIGYIGGYQPWSILSDGRYKSKVKENVPGLEFIRLLKPITYNLNARQVDKKNGLSDSIINRFRMNYDKIEGVTQSGFIAQDVQKAAISIGYDYSGVHQPDRDGDHYSLAYTTLLPSMVKSIQQLSDQILELKNRVADLEAELKKNR